MADTDRDTQWIIHGERVIDDSRKTVWSIASVELPNGVEFEQYVVRSPAAAMMLMVRDDAVLMMHRHRFVIRKWVWELPGGYCEAGETLAECAIREAEEETGWRPVEAKPLVEVQPWVATADALNAMFVSYGADQVAELPPDINEAQELRWIPLDEVQALIASGEIIGAATVVGVQAVLLDRLRGDRG